MKNRPIIVLVAALATAGALAACGASDEASVAADCEAAHEFSTVSEGTLTVAAFDLPPFSKVEGSKITGVDGDIVARIAEKECLTVTVKSVAAPAVIPTVQTGRADLAVGDWYRTRERAEIVNLSDPLYTDQMGLISKESVNSIPDLKGRTVGTVDGYLWVTDLRAYLGSSLKVYASPLNLYQDLKAGRIDVGVDSYGSGAYNGDGFSVTVAEPLEAVAASTQGAQSTLPMPKDNMGLLEAVNANIAELRASGELADILEKHGLDRSAAEPGEPTLIG